MTLASHCKSVISHTSPHMVWRTLHIPVDPVDSVVWGTLHVPVDSVVLNVHEDSVVWMSLWTVWCGGHSTSMCTVWCGCPCGQCGVVGR